MFGRKKSTEPVSDQYAKVTEALRILASALDEIRGELRDLRARVKRPKRAKADRWLQALDRMQEVALVAQGAPDLAREFGLVTRQRATADVEPETEWETPPDPDDGVTYG
jgi:hypothetical protein